MKLKALDQLHISSVQPDSLRPGQEFEVSDAVGADLMKAHPTKVQQVGEKAEEAPQNKAEQDPENKAIVSAPVTKARPRRK